MKTFSALLLSIRPRQWTKNLLVFAALIFSRNLFEVDQTLRVIAAFILFSSGSGTIYILNDLIDIKQDRLHPLKSLRPIASGALPTGVAIFSMAVIGILTMAGAWFLGLPFFIITTAYLLMQVWYCLGLKHVVIVDVFVLAFGFVFRVIAGGVVIGVEISPWLLICTILLSLFLALNKRRHELVTLEASAVSHRRVLEHYSPYLLDQMISVVTASTVVAYALYTMSEQTIEKFGTSNLVLTLPFVLYGIFRYLYLVHQKKEGGSPELTLLTDLPLLADIFLWALVSVIIVYR